MVHLFAAAKFNQPPLNANARQQILLQCHLFLYPTQLHTLLQVQGTPSLYFKKLSPHCTETYSSARSHLTSLRLFGRSTGYLGRWLGSRRWCIFYDSLGIVAVKLVLELAFEAEIAYKRDEYVCKVRLGHLLINSYVGVKHPWFCLLLQLLRGIDALLYEVLQLCQQQKFVSVP